MAFHFLNLLQYIYLLLDSQAYDPLSVHLDNKRQNRSGHP